MKKFLIIACAIMLCCVMLLPVSAEDNTYNFNGVVLPLPDEISTEFLDTAHELDVRWALYELPYSTQKVLVVCPGYWYLHNAHIEYVGVGINEATLIYYSNDAVTRIDFQEVDNGDSFFLWSATKVNEIASNFEKFVCDGTSCPANDFDLNNICDDCGKPLTMSLRNTLYDYAKNLAESKANDGYPYYAIFKWNDTYLVHVSKQPMTSPDGITLSGDGIMYNKVTQSEDGVNGGSGWTNGFYSTYDEFVEANHTISNFKGALPLAEKILGVTEEQLEETLPKLVAILVTLMIAGVGCLASLVLLKIFGKRSLIYRK